jgi:hypothetical protein
MKDSKVAFFVYENKIAYLILTEKEQMGVIIEHKDIADFQRKVFNEFWNQAKNS